MRKHLSPILLAVITTLSQIGVWFSFWLIARYGLRLPPLILGVFFTAIFGSLLGFSFLLLDWWLMLGIVLIGTASFFVFFHGPVFGAILLVLLVIATLVPYARMRHEQRSRTAFSGWVLLRKGLPLFFTLLAFFFAGNVSGNSETLTITDLIPRDFIEQGFSLFHKSSTAKEAAIPLPDINESLDEFIARTLKANGVPIEELSYQDRLLIVGGARDEVARNLGIPLSGHERRSDIVFRLIEKRAEINSVQSQLLIRLLFTFGIFAAIRLFFFPLVWLSIGLFYIILWAGQRTRIFSIMSETINATRLSFTNQPS